MCRSQRVKMIIKKIRYYVDLIPKLIGNNHNDNIIIHNINCSLMSYSSFYSYFILKKKIE